MTSLVGDSSARDCREVVGVAEVVVVIVVVVCLRVSCGIKVVGENSC